jgi:glycine cleavage system aminomethyltransferase T/glycine/D-amino acid oxidase-like deaminating enzyme
MAQELPKHARVVIIGGGIIGTSTAYHLAHLGWKDVVLLERDQLTSGTTWHAAGLMVTFGSTSETSTELRKYTLDLYKRLEAETGQATGLKQCGFIECATDQDTLEEYRRVSAFNRFCGVDVQEISPSQIKELFPLARVDDIEAGFYVANDGIVNPVDVTMAMGKGARKQGAQIIEGCSVKAVLQKNGRVTGVSTSMGDIACEYVVNCAGMWARELGAQSGVNIPNQAAEHYYLITEEIHDLPKNMPVLEDPSHHTYIREEVGGLMVGLFEPICAPWKIEGIPKDFSFGEIPPDWDRMTPYLEKAMSRVPRTLEVGIKKFFCGPESFTPDLRPIVGEAPEVKNYFVAAGLNSIGILTGGGMGRLLAGWIVNGRPDMDVTGMNVDRLLPYQSNPQYRRERTVEMLGMVYKCHYPTKSPETARGAKSPDWYAPDGHEPKVDKLSWGRMNWFPWWKAEHEACRNGVILMDMSFMCKFMVQGRDAGRCLDRISANSVNGQTGMITYTQWLNEGGKLEADLTVTKLADDKFFVVVTDTQLRHAETWMKRNIPDDAHAFVTDVTSGYGQLNIQGPRSRELLQTLTTADLSNEAFPFRTAREIDIGYARVLCVRITYLGELGYELYIPSEQATHVYDQILKAGSDFGLRHAGLKALASLRMEKGYRDYGHDIDNTDNAFETGLGFAVDLKKADFIGREEALKQKASPLTRRMVQVFVQDPEPLLYHAEIVRRNGKAVGYIRAGSYGHTLGGAVGLAMIEAGEPINLAYLNDAKWEVEISGKCYPAITSLKPMFDPEMKKIKA